MTKSLRLSALLLLSLAFVSAGPAHAARFKGCSASATSKFKVDVRDMGAKGDGRTDDTKAIQRAINKVAGTGGTVYVPPGTYRVHTVGKKRLTLKSKMTFKMAPAATLKMFPTDSTHYSVLHIPNATDVIVSGGTLFGDRYSHKGRGGEWGMGIRVERGSKRVTISNVQSKYMWGDGFNLRDVTDVALCRVHAARNRRQGLSIVDGDRILVTRSTFRDTSGTRPGAGIDIEPAVKGQSVSQVRIEHSEFVGNHGAGIMLAGKWGPITGVQIQNNRLEGVRPLLIEYSPRVPLSHVCENRYRPLKGIGKGGYKSFAHMNVVMKMQMKCGHRARRQLW